MHRFLPGLLFLQFLSLLVFWLNFPGGDDSTGPGLFVPDTAILLRVAIPVVLIGIVGAFWFSAISRHAAERAVVRLKDSHAKEREKIKVSAERDRTRMVKETQKEIQKQTRRVSGKANLKVGLAFAGAAVAGVVLIITELITLGMMTMTTAGGAMGGYLLRGKKPKNTQAIDSTGMDTGTRVIDANQAEDAEEAEINTPVAQLDAPQQSGGDHGGKPGKL